MAEQAQAYEFHDAKGELFTAHFLRKVDADQFELQCEGIPVRPGWTLHRRGKVFTVKSVEGKMIYTMEAS